ncbi:gamma-glutamyltransferase [Methylopila sp. Yamaguchi]|uniref:gamma-glutamyltransferase n=1 Tax=Methylopila sp. Yamaguchi TaxID=1437817 RepID=UPI000CAA7DF8|nr:gamma-glutamyltransferase [Methylopila sp. Yamaguchi]GBD47687.1 gamma-glutamyltransferase [Methylopila sp. Yamaguchi]
MSDIVVSTRGAVAAPCREAAETGRLILGEGGDAFEAAVAMAATLAVVAPHLSSLAADAVWTFREPHGAVGVIEARGLAGRRASPAFFHDRGHGAVPVRGPFSAFVAPGSVEGWRAALELSSRRLPRHVLFADALRHAREGFSVSSTLARALADALPTLPEDKGFQAAFLIDKAAPAAGATLRPPRLADALEHLARSGLRDLYDGDLSRELAADLDRLGIPLGREDLTRVEARPRAALSARIKAGVAFDAELSTPALIALLERLKLQRDDDAAFVHAIVEGAKRVEGLRREAEADDRPRVAAADRLTPEALDAAAGALDRARATPLALPDVPTGGAGWIGVVDAAGRAVSVTHSLLSPFGAGMVSASTGVLLSNRGAAFALEGDEPLRPGAAASDPLSAPLMAMLDGRVAVFGASDRPPLAAAALAVRRLGFEQDLASALAAPRIALRRGPDGEPLLALEPGFDGEVADRLDRMGHRVAVESSGFAAPAALIREASGRVEAGADPRGEGAALGV